MADTNRSRAGKKQLVLYLTEADLAELDRAVAASGESRQVIARRGIRREVKRIAAEQRKVKVAAMDYGQLDMFQRIFERDITSDDVVERDRTVASMGVDFVLDGSEEHAEEPWPAGFREWARRQLVEK